MNACLDTSVLVPVFYEDHEHHEASLALFVQCDSGASCCGAHSLVEVFATLTRMPGRHRISAEQAILFIGNILERLAIITLDGNEYVHALGTSAALGIVGGSIQDAILAQCALKARSDALYTWNTRHYTLYGPEVTGRRQTP